MKKKSKKLCFFTKLFFQSYLFSFLLRKKRAESPESQPDEPDFFCQSGEIPCAALCRWPHAYHAWLWQQKTVQLQNIHSIFLLVSSLGCWCWQAKLSKSWMESSKLISWKFSIKEVSKTQTESLIWRKDEWLILQHFSL